MAIRLKQDDDLSRLADILSRHLPSSLKYADLTGRERGKNKRNMELLASLKVNSVIKQLDYMIYGSLVSTIKRGYPLEFWVDQWPDVSCVTAKKVKQTEAYMGYHTVFCLDKSSPRRLLETPGVVDWGEPVMFSDSILCRRPSGFNEGEAWPYPKPHKKQTNIDCSLRIVNCELNSNFTDVKMASSDTVYIWKALSIDDLSLVVELGRKHECFVDNKTPDMVDVYYMDKTDPTIKLDPPDGLTLGTLSLEHAQMVKHLWKHGHEEPLQFFEELVQSFPSLSFFDTNGDPAAYEMIMYNGSMGFLFVQPQHRRKGLARYLTNALAQKVLGMEEIPYVFIESGNEASIRLHESAGFHKASGSPVIWVKTNPQNPSITFPPQST